MNTTTCQIIISINGVDHNAQVKATYYPGHPGCVDGSHDSAVEPVEPTWDILTLTVEGQPAEWLIPAAFDDIVEQLEGHTDD